MTHDSAPYLRELTIGYVRLLDEVELAEKDKKHGGDRQRTWAEDERLHSILMRPGSLIVKPSDDDYSLGDWRSPDLGFPGLAVLAHGIIHLKTKAKLVGGELADIAEPKATVAPGLPSQADALTKGGGVTVGFLLQVDSPYHRIWEGDQGKIWLAFTRNPSGEFFIDENVRDSSDGMEWLASYYTPQKGEHSDDEREFFAPFGAKKLYEAIKHKPINAVHESLSEELVEL